MDDLGFVPATPQTQNPSDDVGFTPNDDGVGFVASQEPHSDQYSSIGQQAIAGLEGAAQGVAGPLAPYIETKLGVKPEDIAGREKENPWTHHAGEIAGLIGGYMSGAGELGLIAKGAEGAANLAKLGKFGSAALKGALEMAALQGSSEASHYITGYDPEQTVSSALANMGYAGIMGAATGGIFGLGEITTSAGLKALEDSKLLNRAEEWLQGFGAKAGEKSIYDPIMKKRIIKSGGLPEGASSTVKAGYKAAEQLPDAVPNKVINTAIDKTAEYIGGGLGFKVGGLPGAMVGKDLTQQYIDPILNKILKKPLTTFSKKYVVPPVLKALTSGRIQALPAAIQMGIKSGKGAKLINTAFDSVFVPGLSTTFKAGVDPQIKARINQNIEDEVMDQQYQQPNQGYAEGGEVQGPNHFADTFQSEAMLLQAAKARVYNHLKQLKPKKKPGLAFDHNEPTKAQEKTYDKALDLAANPLHIFHHLKQGNLTSEHVIHMNQMWPELSNQLRKEAVNRITEMEQGGKKPPYKIRQGLAVLLGTALDTAMTPQGILAAQSAFQNNRPQSQGQQPLKGEKSKLGSKSNQLYKTPNEAGEADQAVRK